MRYFIILLFANVCMFLCPLETKAIEDHIDMDDLPVGAQFILSNNFDVADINTIHIKKSKSKGSSYMVSFKSGCKAVFNSLGDWVLLDFVKEAIPYSLVPSKIRNYVAAKYGPYVYPVFIQKVKNKIEIKLNNEIVMLLK